MKNKIIAIVLIITGMCLSIDAQKNVSDNTLSPKETKDGWKLLFDGKTFTGWMNAKTKEFPSAGWEISEGALRVKPVKEGGKDIVTTGTYRNFELTFSFLVKPGANSGLKYFVDIERDNGSMASIGCEYQIIDDKLHPDAKLGINGNRKLASLYDIMPPSKVKDNGSNNWNNAKIIVNGKKVQHWLNGKKTLEYERGSENWKKMVSASKFKNTRGFGEAEEARILLQYHGDEVWFKNIKIKELK